jgi:FAD/FMN-containing dehydrogenase
MLLRSLPFRTTLFIGTCLRPAAADPSANTKETCNSIKITLPGTVAFPKEANYIKENNAYYHIGLSELGPACIVFPTSAKDVSKIVKILKDQKDVQFVVKSGGHSPNPGHSSIKDGVLIALKDINGTVHDKAKGVIHVKPGGHFQVVMDALEGTGSTVVGARLGHVGIGGYLTQGGLSFLTNQYGMAADVLCLILRLRS